MTRTVRLYTRLDERLISSRIPTEALFDEATTQNVRDILLDTAARIAGNSASFFQKSPADQKRIVQRFVQSIVKPLSTIPHFLYNRIYFEASPIGIHQGLFGSGHQHTYWTIIGIPVNETMTPEIFDEARENLFASEIVRLRSVVRHELAHRLDMERIHLNPIKRIQKRAFLHATTARTGSNDYYGKPTELLAHANHTIELMAQGHARAWREVLANYVLTDTSPGHTDTRRYIKIVSKLAKEYRVPFTQRVIFRRELRKLATQMRLRGRELGVEKEPIALRNELVKIGLSPEEQKKFTSIRLNKIER